MKKRLILAALILLAAVIATAAIFLFRDGGALNAKNGTGSGQAFHIAIITGSADQAVDDLRGAQAFQEILGEDRVRLATYPDNFSEATEETVRTIVSFAEDPEMKAIIVNQAVPGTTEAFRKVKASRPDILCIAGESHEDLSELSGAADLVCNNDFVSRGYLMIHTAHELGCKTFVHISFPRHMGYETMGRRVAIFREACEEFGMEFAMETAPDPTIEGTEEAQAYIMEHAPEWIEKYGKESAYYCTNDAHTEPLIRQLLAYGGYFIEADLPSPLMGYPGALDLDMAYAGGDFKKILSAVETAVVARGGAGRFGTWTYSFGYTLSVALAQHACDAITGKSRLTDIDDIAKVCQEFSPGAAWNGSNYIDAETLKRSSNVFLIYQDTYIMGQPGRYMGTTQIEVPNRYFYITPFKEE